MTSGDTSSSLCMLFNSLAVMTVAYLYLNLSIKLFLSNTIYWCYSFLLLPRQIKELVP